MNHLFERIAYLKGLSEGLNINNTTKEGKLITEIIGTLEEFADVIDNIAEEQDELTEYVESIDEDLMELEDDLDDDMYPESYDFDEEDAQDDCCEEDDGNGNELPF